jgi:5'-3' exonuclease
MGVLQLFATLLKHNKTSNAIYKKYTQKNSVKHFFVDFNSIVHTESVALISKINVFYFDVLDAIDSGHGIGLKKFDDKFAYYGMKKERAIIKNNETVKNVCEVFNNFFDREKMDKLIIYAVRDNINNLLNTYCENNVIKTLLLAIDGVPSKAKMMEQKHRRYMSAFMTEYEKLLLNEYKGKIGNLAYIKYTKNIRWNRNKITPGTAFMNKLSTYLKSDQFKTFITKNRPNLNVLVSDSYEVGEGEKKIVNYINAKLNNSKDTVYVYSPDADMILLCLLLPLRNVFMLRHNQQEKCYDLININKLSDNIETYVSDYINLDVKDGTIVNDIVCISTLFGNDFVPKIESINVKDDFENVLLIYMDVLKNRTDKEIYLVNKIGNRYELDYDFLRLIISELISLEKDFVENNDLYSEYVNYGYIRYVFYPTKLTKRNIHVKIQTFKESYNRFIQLVKNNPKNAKKIVGEFTADKIFVNILMKCVQIDNSNLIDNMSQSDFIDLIIKLITEGQIPKIRLNLNGRSTSIKDKYYANRQEVKDLKNEYEIEKYKFENKLDHYHKKFNAGQIPMFNPEEIDAFYTDFFHVNIYDNNSLSKDGIRIMKAYIEGLLWVFDSYFNSKLYINTWCYQYEKAPLLYQLNQYMNSISNNDLNIMFEDLRTYNTNIKKYFNPVEQLIYVSPLTTDILNLVPVNYKEFIRKHNIQEKFFVDIKKMAIDAYNSDKSYDFDCRSVPYFVKCVIKQMHRPDEETDLKYLKIMSKIEHTETSAKRSRNSYPKY